MTKVVIDQLVKHYGAYTALHGISLTIESGEFIVMVGPSGCGKSTLLRTISGLEDASDGLVEIDGEDVTWAEPGARGIAMVFQSYALYPHMTVAQNMGYGLSLAKRPKAEIDAAVARAAGILKLEDHLGKLPANLSGGQRQRVAIGRAITRSPKVFLFDEPLSNLDAALRTQMRVEIAALHRALGATMIYVTHDQVEAMTMADRIVVMNSGRIEQVGPPLDLYTDPLNRFVAGFLGSPRMNFVAGHIVGTSGHLAEIAAPGFPPVSRPVRRAVKVGQSVTIGLRPEHLGREGPRHPDHDIALRASVRHVELLGRETILFATVAGLEAVEAEGGDATLTVQSSRVLRLRAGDPVNLWLDPADILLFDEAGDRLDLAAPSVQDK